MALSLVEQGFTHNSLLCGHGASAGATIVGQTINSHPGLFQAVSLTMPFLDLLGSLLDSRLALSQSDYLEYGDPNHSLSEYHSVQNLCPYHNLQSVVYPFVHILAARDDFRSPLVQVLKYVTRLRQRGL